MRRLFVLLGIAAVSCALATLPTACGGKQKQTQDVNSVTGVPRILTGVRDFYLKPGQESYAILQVVDGGQLKVLAEVKKPPLKCVLSLREPSGDSQVKVTVIPMEGGKPHTGPDYTLYAFDTVKPLRPGWYRLSVWGEGRVVYLGAAQ